MLEPRAVYLPPPTSFSLHSPFSAAYKAKGAAWDRVALDYNAAVGEPHAIIGRKAKETFDVSWPRSEKKRPSRFARAELMRSIPRSTAY